MAKRMDIKPARTYAHEVNAIKAVEDKYPATDLRYFIAWNSEGRCYPVFVGHQAIDAGVHFHFCVVG